MYASTSSDSEENPISFRELECSLVIVAIVTSDDLVSVLSALRSVLRCARDARIKGTDWVALLDKLSSLKE